MARKKKNELPSGSIRLRVYSHSEPVLDSSGKPVFEDGKPKLKKIYISVTGKSKEEVAAAAARIRMNKDNENDPGNMTLAEAIDRYLDSSGSILSPTTVHNYDVIKRNSFKDLMDCRIRSITTSRLREAVNKEASRTKKTGKPISAKTVTNEYGLIRSVLNTYVPDLNTTVPMPQIVKNQHKLTQPSQIFDLVKGTDIELPVLLAMWMSFTMSEILGLYKSKSISEDGNYISIVQTEVAIKGKAVTKDTAKNPTRRRTHRIPPYIKRLISEVPGDKLVNKSHVALSHSFIRLIDKSGLPHMTFHDLRHVNASVMALLQVPDKYAQERGGWSSDVVMKNTYMQTFSEARTAVDNTIDAYFEQQLGIVQESIPESDLVKINDCENAISTLYKLGYGHLVENMVAKYSKESAANIISEFRMM